MSHQQFLFSWTISLPLIVLLVSIYVTYVEIFPTTPSITGVLETPRPNLLDTPAPPSNLDEVTSSSSQEAQEQEERMIREEEERQLRLAEEAAAKQAEEEEAARKRKKAEVEEAQKAAEEEAARQKAEEEPLKREEEERLERLRLAEEAATKQAEEEEAAKKKAEEEEAQKAAEEEAARQKAEEERLKREEEERLERLRLAEAAAAGKLEEEAAKKMAEEEEAQKAAEEEAARQKAEEERLKREEEERLERLRLAEVAAAEEEAARKKAEEEAARQKLDEERLERERLRLAEKEAAKQEEPTTAQSASADDSQPISTDNHASPSSVQANQEGESITSSFLEDPTKDECSNLGQAMIDMRAALWALKEGRFSYARYVALQIQNKHPGCESALAKIYAAEADAFLATKDSLATIIQMATQEKIRPMAPIYSSECWNPLGEMELEEASQIVFEKWDLCCSQLESTKRRKDFNSIQNECFQDGHRLCCGFFEGSLSHLKLPVLNEVALHLRLDLEGTDGITLEQDGFLRKFDTAAVLWPTGYMLSLCLADPDLCGIPEVLEAASASTGGTIAIELGAGVGAPSIVFSKLLQLHEIQLKVLATDKALHALALVVANSQAVRAPVWVKHLEDHSDLTQLEALGEQYAIVLGSSLMSLFDWKTRDPSHTLWKVLDKLLDRTNPHAIAILAHVTGAVEPPREEGALFELVRSISGNELEMRTRTGDDSDFAISVYRRKLLRQEGDNIGIGMQGEL